MSTNLKKDYENALKYYQKGEFNKALENCEIGIANSLKNTSLLNLKGLLLYLNGELDNAITVWKINKDFNSDSLAKTYIEDSKEDRNREKKYYEAIELIKNYSIDEALQLLMECEKSAFNSIKVNNALAECYFKKGDYKTSLEYITKTLNINKKDIIAKKLLKDINDFGIGPTKTKKKFIILTTVGLIALIGAGTYLKAFSNGAEFIVQEEKTVEENKSIEEDKTTEENIIEEQKHVTELAKNKEVENKAQENNQEESKADQNKQEQNKKLTEEEIVDNYKKATTLFENKNYKEAAELLEETNKSSNASHLNDDILFFLAAAKDYQGLKNEAIKNYEEYITKYQSGNYIEEIYYKLALNYKEINSAKSKEYANIIKTKYENSMYNNSNIDSILKM